MYLLWIALMLEPICPDDSSVDKMKISNGFYAKEYLVALHSHFGRVGTCQVSYQVSH